MMGSTGEDAGRAVRFGNVGEETVSRHIVYDEFVVDGEVHFFFEPDQSDDALIVRLSQGQTVTGHSRLHLEDIGTALHSQLFHSSRLPVEAVALLVLLHGQLLHLARIDQVVVGLRGASSCCSRTERREDSRRACAIRSR